MFSKLLMVWFYHLGQKDVQGFSKTNNSFYIQQNLVISAFDLVEDLRKNLYKFGKMTLNKLLNKMGDQL